jgi:hypothetical protein
MIHFPTQSLMPVEQLNSRRRLIVFTEDRSVYPTEAVADTLDQRYVFALPEVAAQFPSFVSRVYFHFWEMWL